MLKMYKRLAVILGLTLCAAALSAEDRANELRLQQAIDLLESKGDVARATPLFEQASRSSDGAVASRALLYLGGIQERQNKVAARATYERILQSFRSQPAGEEAKRRLTMMGAVQPNSFGYERLVKLENDDLVSLSLDGSAMAVIDWKDSGDIAIQDTATGKLNRLFAKPVTDDDDWEAYGEWAALSPDQSKVLFFWDPLEEDAEFQLRFMPNQPGSKATVLFQANKEITWIDSGMWFPDGQSVLLQPVTSNREWQLSRLNLKDKRLQVIKSLEWRLQGVRGRPSISPNGQYIAYAALAQNPSRRPAPNTPRPQPPDSLDQYIYVLRADGSGSETVVARGPGINEAPLWTSDGSHILFISDRPAGIGSGGGFGLWSVEIDNGKAIGAPSPAMPELGRVQPVGVTSSGSYHYIKGEPGLDVFEAEFQPNGARLKRSPLRLSDRGANMNNSPAWSPDQKSVAFKRIRPLNPNGGSAPVRDLVVRNLETGEEEIYSTPNMNEDPPKWSPDGQFIFLLTGNVGNPNTNQIVRVNVKTRETRPVASIAHTALPEGVRSFAVSPDSETIYLATSQPVRTGDTRRYRLGILSFSLKTGETRTIYSTLSPSAAIHLALSLDGRTFAATLQPEKEKGARLFRLGVDGVGLGDLGPAVNSPVAWTKDRRIFFRGADVSRESFLFIVSDAGSGPPQYTTVDLGYSFTTFDVSPDGSHVLFTADTGATELWKVDNISSLWRQGR